MSEAKESLEGYSILLFSSIIDLRLPAGVNHYSVDLINEGFFLKLGEWIVYSASMDFIVFWKII